MKTRIVTGLIAGAVFVFVLAAGGVWFTFLIAIMALIGYDELLSMFERKTWQLTSLIGFAALLYVVLPSGWTSDLLLGWENIVWVLLFCMLSATVVSKNKLPISTVSVLFLGVLYIGVGFHYMIFTRLSSNGLFWTLLLFACIWLTDSGAYFSGRLFGKNLLWPQISPKKTIEGAIGGIVLSTVAAVVFSLVRPELLGFSEAIVIGIAVALVGQMGDLIQSAYKRVRGVKDSGTLLPGHGGVLDRCDSWLIVFPFFHLVLAPILLS